MPSRPYPAKSGIAARANLPAVCINEAAKSPTVNSAIATNKRMFLPILSISLPTRTITATSAIITNGAAISTGLVT